MGKKEKKQRYKERRKARRIYEERVISDKEHGFMEDSVHFWPLAHILKNNYWTIGTKELLTAKFLNLKLKGKSDEIIKGILDKSSMRLMELELALLGTPTFGCEFYIEKDAASSLDPEFDIRRSINLANKLMALGGNIGIRPCDEHGNLIEIRINPSYGPITASLVKELFELGVLPKDTLVAYSVNIHGKDVIKNGLSLLLANYFTGLTPRLPTTNDGEFNFRDLHIYNGATVNPLTGEIMENEKQLNIFTGVTANIENNQELMPYKHTLENDSKIRIKRMLSPFLVNRDNRIEWSYKILKAVGLFGDGLLDRIRIILKHSPEKVRQLEEKVRGAEYEDRIWNAHRDINVFDDPGIRKKIDEAYEQLDRRVMTSAPKLYALLADNTPYY